MYLPGSFIMPLGPSQTPCLTPFLQIQGGRSYFLFSYKDSNDYYLTQNGSGIWENTGAADGFQILRGNGSLYSAGEIQVYGLTNA